VNWVLPTWAAPAAHNQNAVGAERRWMAAVLIKKKKALCQPRRGIFGNATDYAVYEMKLRDIGIGAAIGCGLAFFATQIFFGSVVFSCICALFAGILAVPQYKKYLIKKRRKSLLIQFKDLLESLATSYASGKNTLSAFQDAQQDIRNQHGRSDILAEIEVITTGMYNNVMIEDLLADFSERSGLADIKSFSETFSICTRMGGNLNDIIMEVRSLITEKVEIEMEIETELTSKKNELNIMMIVPFVITLMMNFFGYYDPGDVKNIIVKILALAAFVFAYVVGKKIVDIKV
jgi:tight adherence protein B